MRIEIRNDSVLIDGYVNVVDRESKLIPSTRGEFVEEIKPDYSQYEKEIEFLKMKGGKYIE